MSTTNFVDDQIWELSLSGGEPDAVAVSTSYGRRGQPVRLITTFGLRGELVMAAKDYHVKPSITAVFPSYTSAVSFPFPFVEALSEYWVPESQILAGRTCLVNHSEEPLDLQFILSAVQFPGAEGGSFLQQKMDGVNVLAGSAGNIQPVLFLGGAAVPARTVFPGLMISVLLQPGERRCWSWVHAGTAHHNDSFLAARSTITENWDARIARLEMENSCFVRVETGKPAWDLAFYLSQVTAMRSMMSATYELPHPSYVNGRLPDRGYSQEGRGRDYDPEWSGQAIQETGYLISILKYAAPDLATGLLLNFLHRQSLDGSAPATPNLSGVRSRHRCPPLLSTQIWKLFQFTHDRSLLLSTQDGLAALFRSWFSAEQDRDRDGFPEWDNVFHAEFEHWRYFINWQRSCLAMDLSAAETTDLVSFLLREVSSLQLILEELGDHEGGEQLSRRREELQEFLQSLWDDAAGAFHHRERDSHEIAAPELLGEWDGESILDCDQKFDRSVHVLIRISGDDSLPDDAAVFIHGRGERGRGRIEKLSRKQISWSAGFGSVISEKMYRYIEKVEIMGIPDTSHVELIIPGTSVRDSSQFLPLWSGCLDWDKAQRLVQEQLLDPDGFWLPAGVPQCAADELEGPQDREDGSNVVSVVRNAQIGEGLLQYGFCSEAAELVTRLMSAISQTFVEDQGFRSFYHAVDLDGLGGLDHIQGLAPLDLFLQALGIKLISPRRFFVEGVNPYPWPVTVRWMGLTIRRDGGSTDIVFPGGEALTLEGEQMRLIELPRPESR